MTRRDWWLWLSFLVVGLLLHAAIPACFPRYEFRTFGPTNSDVLKVDRWTGDHLHMFIEGTPASGQMPERFPLR